ncbi:MAG TPA: SDR family NAD(P)-dependent oxidoreductase [Patescibacteria group bacterium]|nr:SDR family NAD(P)-dependent oxidoreductase [Patescibacteria group bacterium]
MKQQPIALVTGAAKGLGATMAKTLAEQGYIVVLHFFTSTEAAEKTLRIVRTFQPESSMISVDLRNASEVQRMIRLVIQRYKRIDVVVHIVGNFIYKSLAQTTTEEWHDVIASNLDAAFYLSNAVLPYMRKQRSGRMVHFGSVGLNKIKKRSNTTPYYIAKTGLHMLTQQLAFENAPYHITVNMISPGILESSVMKPKTPTGTTIKYADIIRTLLFLLKEENECINGANIEIAAGMMF